MNGPISRRKAVRIIGTVATTISTYPLFADGKKELGHPVHQPPVTGKPHPELTPFDELMIRFVEKHKVPGAALAVTKNSHVVYARGFGWASIESQRLVQPHSLFRIASVSKPLMAVAVLQLAVAEKFGLGEHVFDILPAHDWLPHKHDERIRKITIRHLLQHTGGWDRDISFDPVGRPHEVSKFVKRPLPVGPEDVVRYTLSLPLEHPPGTRFAYSNVGYLILGRLIEHATKHRYQDYVKEHVLKPVGITDMQLGRAWKDDLAHDEVHYYDSKHREAPAVNGPHLNIKVPIVYGGENFEGFEAHGGWIASAIDLVKFASTFDHPGSSKLLHANSIAAMSARPEGSPGHEPNGQPSPSYYGCGWFVRPVGNQGQMTSWHSGLIAGTSTLLVRRSDGLNWAVLFNTNEDPHGKTLTDVVDPLVHQAADKIKHWPVG